MSVDDPIQVLLAERAIRSVLLKYCRAIDRCDADALRSCYHEDARDEHGVFSGGRDDFVEYAIGDLRARALEHGQVTTHLLGNILIDLDGLFADCESYVRASHTEDRPGHFRVFEFNGRYLDRFECRGGDWRILSRVVVHDWSEIREGRRGLIPGRHANAQGVPGPEDPLYL